MKLDLSQSKTLIDIALASPTWDAFRIGMLNKLNISSGDAAGTFINTLKDYPKLLEKLKPDQLMHLSKFISKRALMETPLVDKLTPKQKEQVLKSSYPTVSRILAMDVEPIRKSEEKPIPKPDPRKRFRDDDDGDGGDDGE